MKITDSEKNLDEIVKAEKKKYFKQWRADHPDRVKQHNLNYWRKRAQARAESEAKENDNHRKADV